MMVDIESKIQQLRNHPEVSDDFVDAFESGYRKGVKEMPDKPFGKMGGCYLALLLLLQFVSAACLLFLVMDAVAGK